MFDNPGLYVFDLSSLPGPVGSPPSKIVAAWSSFMGWLLKSGLDSVVKKRLEPDPFYIVSVLAKIQNK